MQYEPLTNDRLTFTNADDHMDIKITAKRHYFGAAFLGFWLCGWAVGEVAVLGSLLGGDDGGRLFLLVWLCGWTAGGVFALGTFLWLVSGQEIISVAFGEMRVERRMIGWRRARRYVMKDVTRFRYEPSEGSGGSNDLSRDGSIFAGFDQGELKFDYGLTTCGFGFSLDEAAVNALIPLLERHRDRAVEAEAGRGAWPVPEVGRS